MESIKIVKKPKKVVRSVYLNSAIDNYLDNLARNDMRSVSHILSNIIRDYLKGVNLNDLEELEGNGHTQN